MNRQVMSGLEAVRPQKKTNLRHRLLPGLSSDATVCNVMAGNTTKSHDPADLGELERSIMQLVWQHGELRTRLFYPTTGKPRYGTWNCTSTAVPTGLISGSRFLRPEGLRVTHCIIGSCQTGAVG
jgi:hypothetical protein